MGGGAAAVKIVIQNDSSVWGGNEKWLATLAAGLVARGHRVVVSCRADGPVRRELERRGVPTTSIRPGGYADVVRGLRFRRWLRWEGPDVLLLTSWRTTPWGAWAARRAGVTRTVVRLGIVRTLRPGRRDAWPFRGRVDALIVNSPAVREAWLRTAPWFPADEVHLVLNGVPAVPALSDEERAAVRAELGLSADTAVVVGAGRLSKRKGFDFLIDAFARADVPGSELLVVGTGEEEAALRAQAAALGIDGRVRFAGERGDVPRVLGACGLFVLSSHNEGMANVMLEAMAAGIPVAAFDVSGVRDAIGPRDGRPAAGWVVPPADTDALASAIRNALLDADTVAARVAEASWRVGNWFSVERMVDEAEAALRGRG
jgi:glycosyltransferase involved in cell wall biosynthesis